jgi:hypothetical protein
MSSGSAAKEFEAFARDCVQLAARADTPELRERLLSMARDWMRAAMEGRQGFGLASWPFNALPT